MGFLPPPFFDVFHRIKALFGQNTVFRNLKAPQTNIDVALSNFEDRLLP